MGLRSPLCAGLGGQDVLLAIPCAYEWPVHQLDAKVTFLQTKREDDVYVKTNPARSYFFSFTSRAIVETDCMISRSRSCALTVWGLVYPSGYIRHYTVILYSVTEVQGLMLPGYRGWVAPKELMKAKAGGTRRWYRRHDRPN